MFPFPDLLRDFVVSHMVIVLHRRRDIQRRSWTPVSIKMLRCLGGVVDGSAYIAVLCSSEELAAEDGTPLDPALLRLSDFDFSENTIDIPLRKLVPEDGTSLDPALMHLSDFDCSEDTIDIQLRTLAAEDGTSLDPALMHLSDFDCSEDTIDIQLRDFGVSQMAIVLHRRRDIQRRGWTPVSIEMLQCLGRVVDNVCRSFHDCVLF
ncbi:UNVERIFIED_CONTAM: hypothetical protein K2H54_057064 [Gekko kuhli]